MIETRYLDIRGLMGPEPAMMAKQAMEELGGGRIEITLDSQTVLDNIERLARLAGWSVEVAHLSGGDFKLALSR